MFKIQDDIQTWIKNPIKSYSNYFYIDKVEFNGLQIPKLQKAALELQNPELFDRIFLCFSYKNNHYICKRFDHVNSVLEIINEHIRQSKCYCMVGTGYPPNEFFQTQQEEDLFNQLSLEERINKYISHNTNSEELKSIVRKVYNIDKI